MAKKHKVDKSEVYEWFTGYYTPKNDKLTAEYIDSVFGVFDVNKDGNISFEK